MFAANRFDGRYGVAVPVWVQIADGCLIVETVDRQPLDREPLTAVAISEPLEFAPYLISLAHGATLELDDPDRSFGMALEAAGVAQSWIVRLQSRWRLAAAAVVLTVALSIVAYRTVLPIAAAWVADLVSPRLEQELGRELLAALDKHYFKPSRLDRTRKAEITADFAHAARAAAPQVRYRLEFRRGAMGEINAFALPGGIIVMLDATVSFGDAIDRDSVLGVLGHELGHVAHRHSTRAIVQDLGVASLANLLWGDFSSIAATIPFALGRLSYSRDFESDADEFALDVLRARDRTALPLYRFFDCLHQRAEHRAAGEIPTWLSSHPSDSARRARLRELGAVPDTSPAQCPPQ